MYLRGRRWRRNSATLFRVLADDLFCTLFVPYFTYSNFPGHHVSCQPCNCADIAGSIGIATSTRSCTNPSPANGGAECVGASMRAVVFCNVISRYGTQRNYRFFGDILPDGTPCGTNKYCLDGECLPLTCDKSALITRDLSCPTISERCNLETNKISTAGGAQWLSWSTWSFCSQTCGTGYRQRIRSCSDGKNQCLGASSEKKQCNLSACGADTRSDQENNWSEWTPWNQCSVSCGTGLQARYRRCTDSSQNSISFSCPGMNFSFLKSPGYY
ncbi:unnamed protein product [Onchocerca flexuosa]|uniref:Thrombospondin type 1 domain protein n=1 Tax=Onchocerca flexuosa TaxID=387005 RepID=A0A183I5F4_9BILA|nr:unnamed protein product [Onchocerca flexuosa]